MNKSGQFMQSKQSQGFTPPHTSELSTFLLYSQLCAKYTCLMYAKTLIPDSLDLLKVSFSLCTD